jgi:alpha-amylase
MKRFGQISRPNVITLLKLGRKTTNKVLDNNPFTPLLKFTITELAADKILIWRQKSKLQKWFQQHDQFRIQMGCPKDYEFIFSKYSNKLNNDLKG